MNCQNCEYPILPSDEKCPHCGAVPLRRRVTFGARREDFVLTREDEPFELGDVAQAEDWQTSVEQKPEPARTAAEPARSSTPEVHWGGFFRRGCRVRARCRGYFGAFNHHVFYVLCRLQGRVVGPWTDTELGAFDALFYVVYLGMDRFGHSLFRDLSRDRRKDHRQVAVGTSSGSRREKRRHLSPGFSTLDWNGWLCSRIVRFPVDSVEPREERMARLFGPYLGNQRLVKNRRNELCRR